MQWLFPGGSFNSPNLDFLDPNTMPSKGIELFFDLFQRYELFSLKRKLHLKKYQQLNVVKITCLFIKLQYFANGLAYENKCCIAIQIIYLQKNIFRAVYNNQMKFM